MTSPGATTTESRLIASVGGYFVSHSEDAIAFHLYGGISATRQIAGTEVAIRERSNYPWSGDIRISVDPEVPATFDVDVEEDLALLREHLAACDGRAAPATWRAMKDLGLR